MFASLQCSLALCCSTFTKQQKKRTALHIAAKQGHNDMVQFLLKKKANINACDKVTSQSSLLLAYFSTACVCSVFQLLLESCCTLTFLLLTLFNPPLKHEMTPLHYAASEGNDQVVNLLLSSGCDVSCVDEVNTDIRIGRRHSSQ